MDLLSVAGVSALLADLGTAKEHLHSDEIIGHLKEYLNDSGVQLKLADGRIQKAETLAADTTSAYQSFDQAKAALAQLGENQGSWLSNWEILFADYIMTVKASLDIHKKGISFFGGFNSDIVKNLGWDEAHFAEAKALVDRYSENPAGALLETDSKDVSQRYTDNRRNVSAYQGAFSGFVATMREENSQAQLRLQGSIDGLNGEIERYNSTGEQIKRALTQIVGIPSWMTWLVSQILGGLGVSSVEDARRALDANYAEVQRLNEQRESVHKEMEQKSQMDADLARANGTLTRLNGVITDITRQLDSFANKWANTHHDIVLLQSEMEAAGDSATKLSLIARLNIMGGSIDALVAGMNSYIKDVEGSGLF